MSLQSSIKYDIWNKEQCIKTITTHHIMSHSGKFNCKNICNPCSCLPQDGASPELRIANTVCQSKKGV